MEGDTITESGRREPGRLSLKVRAGLAIAAGAAILLQVFSSHSGQGGSLVSERECAGPIAGGLSAKDIAPPEAKMLIVSNRTGTYRIYEKDLGTGNMRALTPPGSNAMNPQLSQDRLRLVFYTDRSGSNQIATLSLSQPDAVTQLTDDSGGVQDYDPAYTPDGRIVYKKTDRRGDYGDIWLMNADGSGQHAVTKGLITRRIEAWKPAPVSAAEAVITERTRQDDPFSDNLYLLDLHSGRTQRLTDNSLSNWYPDYNPRTQRLVYITKQKQNEHDVIATMRTDGLDCRVVLHMPGDNNDPSWSADGRYIAFVNNKGGHYSTYLADAEGQHIWLADRSPKGSDDLSPILL